uniref:Uncharacterized protein n=1 Tax=Romanomermis culicivorax TaxID=13658 RepID=A0A915I829_ROMCU
METAQKKYGTRCHLQSELKIYDDKNDDDLKIECLNNHNVIRKTEEDLKKWIETNANIAQELQKNEKEDVGDMILKESQLVKKGLTRKLMPIFQGPYKIGNIVLPNLIIESLENPKLIETVHINRTNPFHGQNVVEENELNCGQGTPIESVTSRRFIDNQMDANIELSDDELSIEDA